MDEYISLEEVFEAYYECRKNKRGTANALNFESDYERGLVELCNDINDKRYEIGRSIAFIVTRPVKREVFAADFRDRIVHHLVARRLEPLFESVFIDDNYNCRKEKGVLFGVKRLKEQIALCSDNFSKETYVMKCDMQGFFMSIHKPTLWHMLEIFIWENYTGADIDILLYLVKKIVLHSPEKFCVRRSPSFMWDDLPKNKSLFTSNSEYGLPIGNLTSQMFANFYLHEFDIWMKEKHVYYGRYVDDFYVISNNKKELLNSIKHIKDKLMKELKITLHPKKLYLQNINKGCKFIGGVIKKDRMYAGSRTVGHMIDMIRRFNKIADNGEASKNAEAFVSSINSYFGFLSHYKSYAIRRKAANLISEKLFEVCFISGHHSKFVCKKKFKERYKIINKIKNKTYDKN